MMKLLADVEKVTGHCEKESNNGQLHNNNSHEKQSATELAQEANKPLVNKVSRRLGVSDSPIKFININQR
jgi:hypothetical protein